MRPATKLLAYAAVLAAFLGIGAGVGAAVGPIDLGQQDERPGTFGHDPDHGHAP